MKEITIISGKGGTGKTSITAGIAGIAKEAVFCDNDVDAANLHLIFQPEPVVEEIFEGAYTAEIHNNRCMRCGICEEKCRFDAISHNPKNGTYHVDPVKCEGCRLCERICPADAITSSRSRENTWYISDSRFGPLVHAEMGPGEENSGKLVSLLRKKARELAKERNATWIINDGPPGIGCAAISSLTGTDAAIIVTEPTLSAFHDLERLTELFKSFKLQSFAIINKADLNPEMLPSLRKFLGEHHIEVIAEIPFSTAVVQAMTEGRSVTEFAPISELVQKLYDAWDIIEVRLGNKK